jgi:putative FmdB family regulatory protein
MPIYEYTCHKCGETIEAIQKMSDPELVKHQGCGGKLTRLLSVPTLQVRESGWQPGGRQHPSVLQQAENERLAKESKKKSSRIINAPAGVKSRRGSSRAKS